MNGAILGDIIGSRFEFMPCKSKSFDLLTEESTFTDDSVMTIAVAEALMRWKSEGGDLGVIAVEEMRRIGRRHPAVGYGESFRDWLEAEAPQPYNSWGNGAAMRVSPCGWIGESIDEVKTLSRAVTEVTHNHPEGIKGAESVAVCVYLARIGTSPDRMRQFVRENYYSMDFSIDDIRGDYSFDSSCQGSVPHALECFFAADGFVDAVRNAVSLGGDADTMAAIAGSIAEAYWGIPASKMDWVRMLLPEDLYEIVRKFRSRH